MGECRDQIILKLLSRSHSLGSLRHRSTVACQEHLDPVSPLFAMMPACLSCDGSGPRWSEVCPNFPEQT